jgi:hypothetical protein
MGECDGVSAVHREVAVSRGVYSRKGRRAGHTRLARRLSQPFLYPITEEFSVTREVCPLSAFVDVISTNTNCAFKSLADSTC